MNICIFLTDSLCCTLGMQHCKSTVLQYEIKIKLKIKKISKVPLSQYISKRFILLKTNNSPAEV